MGDVQPDQAALPEHGEHEMCCHGGPGVPTAPPTGLPFSCWEDNESMLAPYPCQETKLSSDFHSSVNQSHISNVVC